MTIKNISNEIDDNQYTIFNNRIVYSLRNTYIWNKMPNKDKVLCLEHFEATGAILL